MDALHAHGRLRRRQRRADHRARRRLLPLGRERQALPRRARRALLGQHRLRLRRGGRPGRARADARAALLHQLVVRAPEGDRARRRGGVARAGRPEPRLLRLGRLGGGRVRLEAGPAVLRRARREADPHGCGRARAEPRRDRRGRPPRPAPLQGDRPPHRLPRDDHGRALDQRHPRAADDVRAAGPRGAARAQHEPLPPARRGDRGGVHPVPARRPRAGDPRHGPRDGVPRAHGAGAERRWLLHAARGLLGRRARALRRVRHPALRRRGDHRVRPARPLVRLGALRHPARHRHLRQGAVVVVRRRLAP